MLTMAAGARVPHLHASYHWFVGMRTVPSTGDTLPGDAGQVGALVDIVGRGWFVPRCPRNIAITGSVAYR